MRIRRISTALLATAASGAAFAVGVPAASAHVACDPGEFYRVTQHNHTFVQVEAHQAVNKTAQTITMHVNVSQSHTSSRTFSASITASVEGGFWVFAKASASTTAGYSIETSDTMETSFGVDVPVPAHTTRTVDFGFRRYNQYIQQYHLYNNTISTCAAHVDKAGWVDAPYMEAYIVK